VKQKKGLPGSKAEEQTATLSIRIQPRASKNDVSVMEDGKLKIRLTAPPVDGAANEALVKFLADKLDISRSRVEIVSGHTGREKIIRITGMSESDVRRVLNCPV
jgi:uncharacterized protein (TIGR00251 family)